MNRIEVCLQECTNKKEKAFITYMTAGLPDMETSKEIIKAQEKAGTDMIELGVPFSDPVADGPIIQDASYEAICQGVTIEQVFQLVENVRGDGVKMPIIFMMYYNTILHYGVEAFTRRCRTTGVDGLIIPDLPFEEQEELAQLLQDQDETILIQLISPVSGKRIPMILENARGFVYCVSSMGVTGQKANFHKEVLSYLSSVKEVSKIPVMMGFGIQQAKDVAPMKDVIDGAIVGSYFIHLMKDNQYQLSVITDYCSQFKQVLNQL